MSTRKAAPALAAYVLHAWDWSETSLIVELFTRERGRVAVAAKGAKRPYSQLRAVLIPFQLLSVQLGRTPAESSNEVHLLRSAERAAGPPMPAGGSLFAGFYLNELLLKLLARQDPHEALFALYADAVATLQAADDALVQCTLRAFEIALLRQVGLLPDLRCETLTVAPLRDQARYTLQPEAGLVAVGEGGAGVAGGAWQALEAALQALDPVALRAAAAPVTAALRAPLRQTLHYHLGSSWLRTRQVMLDVQKLIEPETARR